jgi:uncharacterized protein
MKSFFALAYKGENHFGYYILGLFFVAAAYFFGQIPLGIAVYLKGPELAMEFQSNMDFSAIGLTTNVGLVLLISMFIFAMFGLLLALRVQKKSLMDITSPRRPLDWSRVLFAFGVWFALAGAGELIHYLSDPSVYVFQLKLGSFLGLLLICVLLLPVQTSLEEFLFRGYLNQALFLLFRHKVPALVICSILFSLVHSMNPEIEKFGFWVMQIYYIGAGLLLGILVIMDEGLELALGVHAATNIFAALIVSYDGGVLQTDSLFKTTELNVWLANLVFITFAVIFYFICSYKYNWPPLLEKLNEPVYEDATAQVYKDHIL